MSGQRVRKVSPISATSSSIAIDVGETTSITSDPANSWVAKRQAEISAALERRRAAHGNRREPPDTRMPAKDPEDAALLAEDPSRPRLSGESERIGTGNWEETVSFGNHVGYL